ncbi:Adenylate-forming reductase Nps10 [Labeo rohita]|uniref:Adenylate-forming reductase Nps10 n=1 Tax=Labeo rohita TaxID=84645 RepID=A0ABQ8L3Q5_LABRO|nr:Adenylate-forming reductase Nps10 [Labeo rohita]
MDEAKACSNEAYKKLSRSAFAKCHALWNKCGRSAVAAGIIEDVCKIQLVHPTTTRWNSLFLAVERVLQIIKGQGEEAIRTVCTSLKLQM